MRIKHIPADFVVKELLQFQPGTAGNFAILQVEKQNLTTQQVQKQLAAKLGYRHSAVNFPALKDRRAIATQYVSVKGNPPEQLQAEKWTAVHVGRLDRPLRPSDLAGNRFTLTLRDLDPDQVQQLDRRFPVIARQGLPNYFDQQRFGSYHPQNGFIGKHILLRDEEAAVRAYLAVSYPADPPAVERFKKLAARHWGDWDALFKAAPRPSNYRSLLTYLRDHPQDFRRALNLIPQPLLSLFLSAYQSALWNRIAGRYLLQVAPLAAATWGEIEIAGDQLPVYNSLPNSLCEKPETISVVMPHHRAVYRETQVAAAAVLQAEGLSINQLKARVLKKAYLSKHRRPLLLFPTDLSVGQAVEDDHFSGRLKLSVSFTLPRGAYATLVLKCAALEKP